MDEDDWLSDMFGDDDISSSSNKSEQGTNKNCTSNSNSNDDEYPPPSILNTDNEEVGTDRKSVVKTSLVAIACGILLIVVVATVVGLFRKASNMNKDAEQQIDDTQQDTNNQQEDVEHQEVENQQNEQNTSNVTYDNNTYVIDERNTNSDWVELGESDINVTVNDNLIDSNFTVMDKKYYAKIAENTDVIEIKTVLTGAISGMSGTYEIEVPYSLGKDVDIGMNFDIHMSLGETSTGEKVINEIKY